ncbi:MAG TPA: peptidoglycan DD-metalloendopeptidase family protein [Chthonomonadaceae bacterium]|nr:peptidoglycan DD-metalloendopeptidase family protein [Chthonomonadaceae bacterium]
MRNKTTQSGWALAIGGVLLLLAAAGLAKPPKAGGKKSHVSTAISNGEANAQKEHLRQSLSNLNHHMKQVETKIHVAKVQENQITETIGVVQGRIDHTKTVLTNVKQRLTVLTDQHVQLERRLEETQRRLAARQQVLAHRLNDNYEHGDTHYFQVLLRSRSVHELLSRGYYVREIVQSDQDLMAQIRDDLGQIKADKLALEKQQQEQQALAVTYETQKQQYAADLQKKQVLLHGVQQVRAQAEDELDDLEDEANAMTSRIRELSELLRRRQEAQRRAAANSGHRSSAAVAAPPVFHGGFQRPCSGPVTSGFGERFHPILHRRRMHTGVDFGAGYGAPIHAAAAGTVLMATYTRGYGNCIILDHGGGVTTLYGHCSSLLVGEGQVVGQGQVIAKVGATGLATGPHLHFEVRHNGTPVAPPF